VVTSDSHENDRRRPFREDDGSAVQTPTATARRARNCYRSFRNSFPRWPPLGRRAPATSSGRRLVRRAADSRLRASLAWHRHSAYRRRYARAAVLERWTGISAGGGAGACPGHTLGLVNFGPDAASFARRGRGWIQCPLRGNRAGSSMPPPPPEAARVTLSRTGDRRRLRRLDIAKRWVDRLVRQTHGENMVACRRCRSRARVLAALMKASSSPAQGPRIGKNRGPPKPMLDIGPASSGTS